MAFGSPTSMDLSFRNGKARRRIATVVRTVAWLLIIASAIAYLGQPGSWSLGL
jgi:hypothetical protein